MDPRMIHLMIEKSKNLARNEGRSMEAVMARLSLSERRDNKFNVKVRLVSVKLGKFSLRFRLDPFELGLV